MSNVSVSGGFHDPESGAFVEVREEVLEDYSELPILFRRDARFLALPIVKTGPTQRQVTWRSRLA